jgi:hypothetical protein
MLSYALSTRDIIVTAIGLIAIIVSPNTSTLKAFVN